MAFLLTNWSPQSSSMNCGKDTGGGQVNPAVGGPAFFTYQTTVNTAAQVAAANFFTSVAYQLSVGDLMFINASDAFVSLRVAAVDTSVTPATITTESFGASAPVGTANITDLAVTTAKIDDLAVTTAKIDDLAVITGKINADAVTNAKLADNAVSLENLDAGITPSHVVKFAGQDTTNGGAAAEAFAVPGILVTDLAFVQIVDDGTNTVTALLAVCTADTLTVTFSADPVADTIFNYQILRAAV
jgi:hypothetical protein